MVCSQQYLEYPTVPGTKLGWNETLEMAGGWHCRSGRRAVPLMDSGPQPPPRGAESGPWWGSNPPVPRAAILELFDLLAAVKV